MNAEMMDMDRNSRHYRQTTAIAEGCNSYCYNVCCGTKAVYTKAITTMALSIDDDICRNSHVHFIEASYLSTEILSARVCLQD